MKTIQITTNVHNCEAFLWKCNFLWTFCTCGPWVNVGEVLVALQFDFIKDVHLLLCRERTIKPHLWSTTNKIRSVTLCLNACKSPFAFGFSVTLGISCRIPSAVGQASICGYQVEENKNGGRKIQNLPHFSFNICVFVTHEYCEIKYLIYFCKF